MQHNDAAFQLLLRAAEDPKEKWLRVMEFQQQFILSQAEALSNLQKAKYIKGKGFWSRLLTDLGLIYPVTKIIIKYCFVVISIFFY